MTGMPVDDTVDTAGTTDMEGTAVTADTAVKADAAVMADPVVTADIAVTARTDETGVTAVPPGAVETADTTTTVDREDVITDETVVNGGPKEVFLLLTREFLIF